MDEAVLVLMTDTWSATQQPYAKVLIYDVASGEVQRVDSFDDTRSSGRSPNI